MLSMVRASLGTYTGAELLPVVLEAFMVGKMRVGFMIKPNRIVTMQTLRFQSKALRLQRRIGSTYATAPGLLLALEEAEGLTARH